MLGCIAVGIVSAQTGETEPVTVEGLNYELNAEAKTATVVEGEYAGEINIPENITVEDVVYTVTAIGESAFQEDRNDPDKVTSVTIPNTVENAQHHRLGGMVRNQLRQQHSQSVISVEGVDA